MRVVALEEHYADAEVDAALGRRLGGPIGAALSMSVERRIAEMDTAGIHQVVLSLAPPGLQGVTGSNASVLAREVNDRLADNIKAGEGRLGGFAALPTIDPVAAADELARCVEVLGFHGALINGPTGGKFLDAPEFRPILKRAENLGVPIYIHPSDPLAPVRESYLEPYATTHPMFGRAGWGYTIETGTHAMRVVLSSVFDDCPDLQMVLGHLGETIPFLLCRIDEALARDTPMKNFAEVFRAHFHITTSGFFSDAALACCLAELGSDRVMFSIDSPFASTAAGMSWLRNLDLDAEVKTQIAAGNADRLLRTGTGGELN